MKKAAPNLVLKKTTIKLGNEPDAKHSLTDKVQLIEGDLCQLYSATYDTKHVVIKKPLTNKVNKLMKREASVVTRLTRRSPKVFAKYLPELIDSYVDEGKQTNMFAELEGYYSLEEVLAQYPEGIHPRDLAWMTNRVLELLSYVHECDIIHGAINPAHIMINPETHGAVLVDWCHSVNMYKPIAVISEKYKGDYPPEVAAKKGASRRTDLYMVGKTMLKLVGTQEYPIRITGFLKSLCIGNVAYRPTDAREQGLKFKMIQEDVFGPPAFHKFEMKEK